MGNDENDIEFMKLAKDISKNSKCVRAQVGAIIVKDNNILAEGYNAVPRGIQDCTKETCIRNVMNVPSGKMQELEYGVHAEQNAILDALHRQINIEGSTMYVTKAPCMVCARIIINAGIVRLVYAEEYEDELAIKLLKDAKIELKNVR